MAAVRDAVPADARAIAEVHVSGWRWAYRDLLPASLLEGLSVEGKEASWRERLAAPRADAGCVLSEVDGRIVGFASFGPGGEGNGPCIADAGELDAIYLLREAQGIGVGRRLLEAAQDRLRSAGFETAFLWVLEANDLGRRFYERAGWSWDGTESEHRFDCGNRPIVRYVRRL